MNNIKHEKELEEYPIWVKVFAIIAISVSFIFVELGASKMRCYDKEANRERIQSETEILKVIFDENNTY